MFVLSFKLGKEKTHSCRGGRKGAGNDFFMEWYMQKMIMKYITEIAVLRYHTISMTALLSESSKINGGHETGSDSLYTQLECFWGTFCPSIIVLVHKQQSIYGKQEAISVIERITIHPVLAALIPEVFFTLGS